MTIKEARDFLAQRIRYNPFFGDLNMMKWLIDDLYEIIEFDPEAAGEMKNRLPL
jgi:hypothetical protein